MPTKIEWAEETWNPITGCSMASPGCHNCYAARMARRFDGQGRGYDGTTRPAPSPGATWMAGAYWSGRLNWLPERLEVPLRWRKPRSVFVCSMSDLFHEANEFPRIAAIYGIMASAPAHRFMVLTKRADRMLEFYRWLEGGTSSPQQICADHADEALINLGRAVWERPDNPLDEWPLPNVWTGVSVEDQRRLDARLPYLERVPSVVRWLSCEPLIGPLDFEDGPMSAESTMGPWSNLELGFIRWVVAGGESGAGSRPPHPDWFRRLRDDCVAAGVPFFFKQWGSWAPARLGLHEYGVTTTTGATPAGGHTLAIIDHDGKQRSTNELSGFTMPDDWLEMRCVGKGTAGRELDGRTWDEVPEVPCG